MDRRFLVVFVCTTLSLTLNAPGVMGDICASVYPRAADFRLTNFTKSPFYLIQSDNFYNEDQSILVEIGGASFRGFLLAAVDPLTGRRIGSFVDTQGIFTLPCSAAIHSDYHLKKHALLMWRPPKNSKGFVAFEITLMDELGRFLVGQISILPHQLFTHLQMIPIYTRAAGAQLSSTTYPVAASLAQHEQLQETLQSHSQQSSPISNTPRDSLYRFVPLLMPSMSRSSLPMSLQAEKPLRAFVGSEVDSTNPTGTPLYMPAESVVHQQTLHSSPAKTPCAEKLAQGHTSGLGTLSHHHSHSSGNPSGPHHSNGSQQPVQLQHTQTQSIPSESGTTSTTSQPNSQPFNQLLGKLLHSISASAHHK